MRSFHAFSQCCYFFRRYTVGAFCSKNNDALPPALEALLQTSKLPLLAQLFAGDLESGGSVTTKFAAQMENLKQQLDTTRCSFARCIKPNANMTPGVFDKTYTLKQMRVQVWESGAVCSVIFHRMLTLIV
jgi:myosin-6